MEQRLLIAWNRVSIHTYVISNLIVFLIIKLKLNLLDIRLYHYGQEMGKKCIKV